MSKKEEKSANFAVAVIGPTVFDALGALREELKGLREITETQYKTGADGKITGFTNSIQNETSIEKLVQMHSSASGRASHYDSSLARLSELTGQSIAAPVWKDNGASLESIEADIALRIQVLNVSERKAVLEALVKEAESYLTREDQFKMFQEKMARTLGR